MTTPETISCFIRCYAPAFGNTNMIAGVGFEHVWWNWFIYAQGTFTTLGRLIYFNFWLFRCISLSSVSLDIWHLELVSVGSLWINIWLTHFSSICRIFKTSGKTINISSGHALVIISHQTLYFDGIMSSCEYNTLFIFHFRLIIDLNDVFWSFLHWSLTLQISIILRLQRFQLLILPKIVHAGCFIHLAHLWLRILYMSTDRLIFALILYTWWLRFVIGLPKRCRFSRA